jgi:hypothetical protein
LSTVTFNLHSLGWKAFQDLCATILSEVLGQTLQQFFDSHDGGRDGAFAGVWNPQHGEEFRGSFTVQCKFTAKADNHLSVASLKDEIKKARRLASKGLASTYLLLTNFRMTGTSEEQIRSEFSQLPGVSHVAIFGVEWISAKIRESSRLRMLVPRIYGLGDLSQILDERAYAQANEILSSMGEDLSKFVITDAYRKSAKSLLEHGFVLLLGEPASGKSTIAASLSVASIDEWKCRTLKVRNADELVKHSNPHEKQLFWIDDAFGATQLDHMLTMEWNRVFPHLTAAIRRGSRFIFTSRDYVFRAAADLLKLSAFPLLANSQVVIRVEQLSLSEREQILYNHVRLGRQLITFRSAIKPFLPSIAVSQSFKPEIARRLGDPVITANLCLTISGIRGFVERPVDHLVEVIRTMDSGSRAALATVFMRGGSVSSPVRLSDEEMSAIQRIGSDSSGVLKSLRALNESLVLQVRENGEPLWKFRHPTVRDAFGALISEDLDLLDIYLKGSPVQQLLAEISCGDLGITGLKVVVPQALYGVVLERLEGLLNNDFTNHWQLSSFLAHKCDRVFLEAFIRQYPAFIQSMHFWTQISEETGVAVLYRLHEFKILPEEDRTRAVAIIRKRAIEKPDAGFLTVPKVRGLFMQGEIDCVLKDIRSEVIGDLTSIIDNWKSDFSYDDDDSDPESHFYDLISTLHRFEEQFADDAEAVKLIARAFRQIDSVVEELREEAPMRPDDRDREDMAPRSVSEPLRSLFDDVDQ